jgi:hypothetical protein
MSSPQYKTIPRYLGVFDFSDFSANATKWKQFRGCLNRNAKQRTFIFQSTLDQPTSTSSTIQLFDSTLGFTGLAGSPSGNTGSGLSAGAQCAVSSQYSVTLGTNVDSVNFGIPMGATLPTSGGITLYVVEVL